MHVRFELRNGQLVRDISNWEGPVPDVGDSVVLTLDPRTSPVRPGLYEPGILATFRVWHRSFVRKETKHGVAHEILVTLELP